MVDKIKSHKAYNDTCIVVACYSDLAKDIKVGTRWIVAGKQPARSKKTWQIILKPFAKKESKK